MYVANWSWWVERKKESMRCDWLIVYSRVTRLFFSSLPNSTTSLMRGDEPCGEWCDHLMNYVTSLSHSKYQTLSTGTMCHSPVQCHKNNNMWSSQRTFSRCLGPWTRNLRDNCLPTIALPFQTETSMGGREGRGGRVWRLVHLSISSGHI